MQVFNTSDNRERVGKIKVLEDRLAGWAGGGHLQGLEQHLFTSLKVYNI